MDNSHKLYQVKASGVHGKGVFATEDIPKGTKIIEYLGEIISKKEGDKRAKEQYEKSKKDGSGSVFVFELNKKQDIDGDVSWNPAKYLNHSCNPNCKYKIIDNHIWIISIKPIKKDEELNFDYGCDTEDYENHICRCNSENCIGYIIGRRYWKKFLNKTRPKL